MTKFGEVYSWGNNNVGQLGLGDITNINIPQKLIFREPIMSICCGGYFTIAITNCDTIYVWGKNNGQLGLGDDDDRCSPTELNF